jgi:hypoxanthine phosphoribosyltransferase
MQLSERPLLTAEQIAERVAELAEAISADYAGKDFVLVTVLKGATIFAADLMRRMRVSPCLDFIRARSYVGTDSCGHVEITLVPERRLEGADVLVVEDILDTGRTTHAVMERLRRENPAGLKLCTLLDKPARRILPVEADYVGFAIDNLFVVGYGLDHDDAYRHLPAIHTLDPGE